MYLDMGRMVEDVFRKYKCEHRGCNVTWLASMLNCDRRNVYDIFRRTTIDTQLLAQISMVLEHNFFRDIADLIDNRIKTNKPDARSGLSFFIYPLSILRRGSVAPEEFGAEGGGEVVALANLEPQRSDIGSYDLLIKELSHN